MCEAKPSRDTTGAPDIRERLSLGYKADLPLGHLAQTKSNRSPSKKKNPQRRESESVWDKNRVQVQ